MDRHLHRRFFRYHRRNRPFPFFRCDSSSGLLVSCCDAILKLGGCLKLFLGGLCLLFFFEALCFSECLHLYLGASRPSLGHDYFARVLIRVLSTSLDAGRIGSGRGHLVVWKSRDGGQPEVELVPFFDPCVSATNTTPIFRQPRAPATGVLTCNATSSLQQWSTHPMQSCWVWPFLPQPQRSHAALPDVAQILIFTPSTNSSHCDSTSIIRPH